MSPTVLDLGTATFEELIAADLCECGQRLSTHPPVPNPKPMGRPQADRVLLSLVMRSKTPTKIHHRTPRKPYSERPKIVSPRMRQILDTLERNGGNKTQTARQLGITVQAVQQMVYRKREIDA